MDGMGGDATLQANDRGDPSAGPDVAPKAVGFGPMVQECWQTEQLAGGQPARSTGAGAAPEGLRTPVRARAIHWLTAPSLALRASAIWRWDQPCC